MALVAAAGTLLVREGGGVVLDRDGGPMTLETDSVVAGAPGAVQDFLRVGRTSSASGRVDNVQSTA